MARTREVYPTDQVIHLWAHQSQERARNGSNVRFEGKLLYSYSTVIAQIEIDAAGTTWAFLSSESLTPTTAKHVSTSRQATRHQNQILTPAFSHWSRYGRTIEEMLIPLTSDLASQLKAMPRLRVRLPYAVVNYDRDRRNLIECAAAFGVAIEPPPEVPQALRDKAATQYDKQQAKNAEENRLRRLSLQERQEEDRLKFEKWLTTGAGQCPAAFTRDDTQYITIAGEEVKTSLGATAPLDHVRKALRFYESRKRIDYTSCELEVNRSKGAEFTPYHTNGHKVPLGNFTLDSIDEHGNVKAGCHFFSAAEIRRFAEQWKDKL